MNTHDAITNTARAIECRIAYAAKTTETPPRTLGAAIKRGEIKHRYLVCGCCLVDLADAKRWAGETRKRGRPKSSP